MYSCPAALLAGVAWSASFPVSGTADIAERALVKHTQCVRAYVCVISTNSCRCPTRSPSNHAHDRLGMCVVASPRQRMALAHRTSESQNAFILISCVIPALIPSTVLFAVCA